jgi:hypothetical protein
MATKDANDLDRSQRPSRKHQRFGGRRTTAEADALPNDLAEQFRRHVAEYEQAPWTTHFRQLEEAGVQLPAPEALNDRQLKTRLWAMIHGLARLRVFLANTNHLSDRQLYTHLWQDGLRERVAAMPVDEGSAWQLDMLGSGSLQDILLHLKYYADNEWRNQWAEQFPGDAIPPHEDPPFDRDRRLPRATYGA